MEGIRLTGRTVRYIRIKKDVEEMRPLFQYIDFFNVCLSAWLAKEETTWIHLVAKIPTSDPAPPANGTAASTTTATSSTGTTASTSA